jgi:hypothetical protein
MKLAAWTDSRFLIANPIAAEIHENAKPTRTASPIPSTA